MVHTKPDIVYLLIWHLNQYKWVDLPGVAVFNAQEQEAYIDHASQTIYPPVLKAKMVESNIFQTDEMLNHMVSYTGYDKNELNRLLGQLCKNILEELNQKGESYFIPFGRFTKSQGQIQFESNGRNLHEQYFGMKEQHLKPLAKKTEEFTPVQQIEPPARKKSDGWYSEFKYLFWIILGLWIIFLGLLFCPSKKRDKTNVQPPITQIDEDSLRREDSMLRAIIENNTASGLKDSTLMIDTITEIKTPESKKEAEFQNERIISPENVEELDKAVRHKTCVIIIGSFLKKSNADRLGKKLSKDGYQLYRSSYKDFTRIGVKFDCMSRKLQDVLAELKAKYDPQAWILKY